MLFWILQDRSTLSQEGQVEVYQSFISTLIAGLRLDTLLHCTAPLVSVRERLINYIARQLVMCFLHCFVAGVECDILGLPCRRRAFLLKQRFGLRDWRLQDRRRFAHFPAQGNIIKHIHVLSCCWLVVNLSVTVVQSFFLSFFLITEGWR